MSMTPPSLKRRQWFQRVTIASLFYSIMVIVFGAWVRVTGSGAGCGQSWPTCHGAAIPRSPSAATVIEFTHRATSSLCLVAVIVMVALAYRWYPKFHLARKWAVLSLTLMVTEALLGAGLVIFGLVEDNDSVTRAIVMTLHLVNTLALTGAMVTTIHWGGKERTQPIALPKSIFWATSIAAAALVLTSMTGAVTALGDTLYPVDGNAEAIVDRLQLRGYEAAHFLIRLRILHPIIAVLSAIYVAILGIGLGIRSTSEAVQRWGYITCAVVVFQIGVGFLNIALSAPGWMQLTHLAVATLLWCAFVLFVLHLRDAQGNDRAAAQAAHVPA